GEAEVRTMTRLLARRASAVGFATFEVALAERASPQRSGLTELLGQDSDSLRHVFGLRHRPPPLSVGYYSRQTGNSQPATYRHSPTRPTFLSYTPAPRSPCLPRWLLISFERSLPSLEHSGRRIDASAASRDRFADSLRRAGAAVRSTGRAAG